VTIALSLPTDSNNRVSGRVSIAALKSPPPFPVAFPWGLKDNQMPRAARPRVKLRGAGLVTSRNQPYTRIPTWPPNTGRGARSVPYAMSLVCTLRHSLGETTLALSVLVGWLG
jgi:homospermidine synthase